MGIHGDKLGLSSIVGSKAMIEKGEVLSGGILTFSEGDIIEIETPQFDLYQLGDQIKITIYSSRGIYVFETMVVAKGQGALMIIHPPEHQKKFGEQREHPRVDVNHTGLIYSVYHQALSSPQQLAQPVQLALSNVSLGGIGFKIPNSFSLKERSKAEVELTLGDKFSCQVQIVRSQLMDNHFYYGAKFTHFPENKINTLRAFILKTQLEARLTQRVPNPSN